jgi:hypothetical protein
MQPDAICEITAIQLFFLHPWDKFDIETTVTVNDRAQCISSGFAMLLMDFVSIDDQHSCTFLLDALLYICALVSVFYGCSLNCPWDPRIWSHVHISVLRRVDKTKGLLLQRVCDVVWHFFRVVSFQKILALDKFQ